MLNRRILRIKVFKVLYAYAENPSMSLKEAEAQFEISCEAARNLYIFMLGIIPYITDEAKRRTAASMNKFNPSEEEKAPNLKFVNNGIAPLLASDPDFTKIFSRKKFSWEQNDAFIRKLYDSIRTKPYFEKYMADPASSLSGDAKLFRKVFEEEFVDNSDLDIILEDMSVYWNDDLAYSLTYCCRTLSDLAKGKPWTLPPLYQSDLIKFKDPTVSSDKAFSIKLLRSSFTGYDRYYEMIAEAVPKWDKDRLFITDVVLIIMGLAEACSFPDIPVNVSINEYVEISKYYSTPKSRSFVNGLLDVLIQKMAGEGLINKND
jgi:N utilization substance protein B